MFDAIKVVHVAAATVSISLFVLRGLWMLRDSAALRRRWVRIAPHLNDTILLAAGITLAVMSRQSPIEHPWLAAKIGALLVYIALGMLALKPWLSRRGRIAAWLAAIAVFGFIVSAAITRSPLPFRLT